MAELVDARDSKSRDLTVMRVRFSLWAHMTNIPRGTYRHYKGNLYQVVDEGKDHETLEDVVIYRALYHSEFGDRTMWVRPKKDFLERVVLDGVSTERYKYLGPLPKQRLIGKLLAVSYFDLLIFLTAAILLLGVFVIVRDFRDPGFFFAVHKYLGWFIVTLFSLCIYGIGYARFVGPWLLKTNYYTIKTPALPEKIRIAVIADLQVGDHKRSEWIEKVVERIQKQKPDLVLIAGDLVSNELNPEDESVYLEPLGELTKEYPVYAVLGNHDYGIGLLSGGVAVRTQDKSDEVRARCKLLGIHLLENAFEKCTVKNQTITIFGVDDEWGGKPNYAALKEWNTNQPIILLAHNPDAILSWPVHLPKPTLTVAGHTHGGQLKIPFIGPIGDAYLKLPKIFYKDVHEYNDSPVFVTTGVGESLGPFRMGVKPEVAIVDVGK